MNDSQTRIVRASVATHRVLVTDDVDGRSRSALAAVRALHAAGYAPVVGVGPSGRSMAAASRYCTACVTLPAPEPNVYAAALTGERLLAVLPSSDLALRALAGPGHELIDKTVLAERTLGAGLAPPGTRIFANVDALRAAAATLRYPAIVKPRFKRPRAALQVTGVDSPQAVAALPAHDEPVVVQDYVSAPMRSVSGVIFGGVLKAIVHARYVRTWPVECGVSCLAVTTEPDLDLERHLAPLLAACRGVFQVQLCGEHVIDINPRVYGSLSLAVAAGANLPAIACDLERGVDHAPIRAEAGRVYRWLEGDLRHAWAELCSGRLSPGAALRRLWPVSTDAGGACDHRDLGPLLVRAGQVFANRLRRW